MSYNDDEPIGFKRPPRWTQFKPGKSGNPNGRPKKQQPQRAKVDPTQSKFDETLRAELDRTVAVNEGGKAKKVKMRDLVPRAQINLAVKGNSIAQQHVMKAIRELELRDAERAAALAEEEKAKHEEDIRVYDFIVEEKEERARVWAEAEAQGIEPDQPWPHPDDIVLFPKSKQWRVRGPWDETNITYYKWLRAERDYMFAVSMQELWQNRKLSRGLHNLYTVLWVSYDIYLPLRWQLSGKMDLAFFNLSILTDKQLQAEIDARHEHARFIKALAGVSDEWDKDSYREVNAIMKPLLRQQGYRSLREFEHAYQTHGENMPWPKGP
jgi:hypothetical protein